MKIGQASELANQVVKTSTSPSSATAQKAGQDAVASSKDKATPSGVSVSVSKQARALSKTEISSAGDIDQAKVASVKAAIQNGSYQVNPGVIADKLLSNAQEMLKRTPS